MLKRFIFVFLTFCFLYLAMVAAAKTIWVITAPNRLQRNYIESGIHTVVLGPSNGECSWNDSIIHHSKNLCNSGVSLGVSYNSLKWIVEYNEVQIDTVVVCAGFASFVDLEDSRLPFPSSSEELFSVLDYKSFLRFYSTKAEFWKSFVSSLPIWWYGNSAIGGTYQYLVRDKVYDPQAYYRINGILERYGGKYGITEEKLYDKCTYQINNLRKIRKYCEDHNKTLVILSPPVYKYPEMIDDTGYRRLIRKELGDSALIADYSSLKLPDPTYYGDLEHVNHKGAKFFSEDIAKNGLKLQYAIDYAN